MTKKKYLNLIPNLQCECGLCYEIPDMSKDATYYCQKCGTWFLEIKNGNTTLKGGAQTWSGMDLLNIQLKPTVTMTTKEGDKITFKGMEMKAEFEPGDLPDPKESK